MREFQRLTVEQGLSFEEVTTILQDKRGFMWFGTANGLNMFDGYSFTVFRTDVRDSTSISGNWISALYEDSRGDLWISGTGLNRYDRLKGTVTRQLYVPLITSMCEDTSGDTLRNGMWFTSCGQGMYHFRRGIRQFVAYRHREGDPKSFTSDSMFCASIDAKGRLWVGTAHGLNSLEVDRREVAHYPDGPTKGVNALLDDPDRSGVRLWIGASDGLYLYDASSGTFLRCRNDIGAVHRAQDNDVRTIYCDRKGRLWVGMKGGMACFDRSTRRFTSYQGGLHADTWGHVNKAWSIHEERTGAMWMVSHWDRLRRYDEARQQWMPIEIASDHEILFHCMCQDVSGTMWFGTVADAVLKLDPARKQFSVFSRVPEDSSSLSYETVTGICTDTSGTLWVGTLNGLNVSIGSHGTFIHYRHNARDTNSLAHEVIWPILEDREGRIWIGTDGGGLDEFNTRTKHFVHHKYDPGDPVSLPGNAVHSLALGRDGTIWVGAGGSLAEYLPSSRSFRRHFPGYQKSGLWSDVRAILEDRTGLIWIANPGGGLNSYNRSSDTWTQYVHDPTPGNQWTSLGDMGVRSLCEDHTGTLWVGTDGGLFRLDRRSSTFTPFTMRDGLASDYVTAILEDARGNLWLSTAGGVSKFDPEKAVFRNYGASDGITIGECRLPTGHKRRDGMMYFGGSRGFVRFHPDSIHDNTQIPPVVITAFKKSDLPVALDTTISEKRMVAASYAENTISFEFAALNYTSPEKNQYAYRLDGFDKDWTYCGARRYATYTNLDGGEYLFRVKASNNDGVWNEQGVSIAVIVTPPFWRRWWFTTLLWGTLAASIAGTIRYFEIRRFKNRLARLEQERALERERIRISQDLHDELGASLSKIAILSELAMAHPGRRDRVRSQFQSISQHAREVVDGISAIVWAINPHNDKLDNLAGYMREYASEYFADTPVDCRFDFPDDLPDCPLSAGVRRTVFLVMKEALNNVAKHSGATTVLLGLGASRSGVELRIEDDGRGFDPAHVSPRGNGLFNMRTRIQEVGGVYDMHSEPGRGTRIRLVVPSGLEITH